MYSEIILITIGVASTLVTGFPLRKHGDDIADLIKYAYNNNGFGSYSFEYETSDGSYRREQGGIIKPPDSGAGSLVVRGAYRFIDPQGNTHSVFYVADHNGFQPQIDHTDGRFSDRIIVK